MRGIIIIVKITRQCLSQNKDYYNSRNKKCLTSFYAKNKVMAKVVVSLLLIYFASDKELIKENNG